LIAVELAAIAGQIRFFPAAASQVAAELRPVQVFGARPQFRSAFGFCFTAEIRLGLSIVAGFLHLRSACAGLGAGVWPRDFGPAAGSRPQRVQCSHCARFGFPSLFRLSQWRFVLGVARSVSFPPRSESHQLVLLGSEINRGFLVVACSAA
jgi:hypothetical protein